MATYNKHVYLEEPMTHAQQKSLYKHHFEIYKKISQGNNGNYRDCHAEAYEIISQFADIERMSMPTLMDVLDSKYHVVIIDGHPFAVYIPCFVIDRLWGNIYRLPIDNSINSTNIRMEMTQSEEDDEDSQHSDNKEIFILVKGKVVPFTSTNINDRYVHVNMLSEIAAYVINLETDVFINEKLIYVPFSL